jgi:hypothetical protein
MGFRDKEKQCDYQRQWMKRRREEWMENHPLCIRCGSSKNLVVHHVNPSEKIDHKVWSWSEDRRNKELEKCIVICAKCHNKEHHPRSNLDEVHGTVAGYRTHYCRCDQCRRANADYELQRKMKKNSC